ncbi:murein L,D-transpeptidase family protein [Erythrobacter sp. MTPC3]|uniref:L,D-transpeptidase family protein n=1 Tax=Erythrobacter sp. MTPC3 TaxID=3056564 RepID=UPI0036F2FBAE
MNRFFASLLLLLLAACAGPPVQVAEAPQPSAQIGTERAVPAPAASPARAPLVADYLLVDKSERLLIAYRNGKPIRSFRGLKFGAAPTGHKRFEGDERTPEGLYTIDTRNPQSRFHLSLRISYPNRADRAFAAQYGRSAGGDIFIHGQPTGYRGPPLPGDWTDGCIALTNAEIEELWRIVPDGTPIEIRA